MGTILRLSEIPLDRPLSEALYDSEGSVVVSTGNQVSRTQLEEFARKGLKYLESGEPRVPAADSDAADEPGRCSSPQSSAAVVRASEVPHTASPGEQNAPGAAIGSNSEITTVPAQQPAGVDDAKFAAENPRPYSPDATKRVDKLVQKASGFVNSLGHALVKGLLQDASPLYDVATEFLQELHSDCDQVVAQTIASPHDQELAVRSVQMSVLSMAICRAMKLTDSDCLAAGTAAMLHDMALFRLPEAERFPHVNMSVEARRIYECHPSIAYDLLEKVRDIDGTIRIIVLQVHEQADGSGFPKGITLPRIHRLGRVLNVVDTYLRLVGCGSHGQNIFPADAMAYLMHHSCDKRFDPAATCGLIKAISLYPIGSLVQLNSYTTARVIRSNPDAPLKPVVVPAGEEQVVDLSTCTNLGVIGVVDDPELGRRRLSSAEFDRILW